MNTAYVYLQLYKLFDKCTPVKVDCGELCNKACCKGDDCGMYLFPGEKKVYELLNEDWIKITKSDFYYTYKNKTYNVPIALCNENCDRFARPLACRIFPLTPVLRDGKIEIITDPRAKSLCPLSKGYYVSDYQNKFVKNIQRAFTLLCTNPQFKAFFEEYSKIIEEYNRFFN